MSISEYATSSTSSISEDSTLGPTGKRLDYITWHQHHMYMAKSLCEMSTEQQPFGCYIVDQNHYQIVSGYSGEVISIDDSCNCAIISALRKLRKKGCFGKDFIMYITTFPDCNSCLERILEMRISKIWYWSSPDAISRTYDEFYKYLEKNGVLCEKYVPTRTISIDFHE